MEMKQTLVCSMLLQLQLEHQGGMIDSKNASLKILAARCLCLSKQFARYPTTNWGEERVWRSALGIGDGRKG